MEHSHSFESGSLLTTRRKRGRVTPRAIALHVCTLPLVVAPPLILSFRLFPLVHVLWTCDAGRAGAQPYHAKSPAFSFCANSFLS